MTEAEKHELASAYKHIEHLYKHIEHVTKQLKDLETYIKSQNGAGK